MAQRRHEPEYKTRTSRGRNIKEGFEYKCILVLVHAPQRENTAAIAGFQQTILGRLFCQSTEPALIMSSQRCSPVRFQVQEPKGTRTRRLWGKIQ